MELPDVRRYLPPVPFAIVGAVAAGLYMPPRHTDDTDILVHADDASAVERALRAAGATDAGPLTIGGSAWQLPDGTDLDVLAWDRPWVRAALASPHLDPRGVPAVRLPYLVLMKMQASRLQDITDIGRMLAVADDAAVTECRALIERYLPDDVEDFDAVVALGRAEAGVDTGPLGSPPDPDAPAHRAPSGDDAADGGRRRQHDRWKEQGREP